MTNLSISASMQDYNTDKNLIAISVRDADFIKRAINVYVSTLRSQSYIADAVLPSQGQIENIMKTLNEIINYHDDFFGLNGGV